MLLSRFKNSDAFQQIESASQRWHEIPFSYPSGNVSVNGVIDLLLKDSSGNYTVIDFKTDELKGMNDLTNAIERHKKQLDMYRKALKIILGEDPVCKICFLDYCGKTELVTVGKDDALKEDDVDEPYDWMWEDNDSDDYLFEENEKDIPPLFMPE